MKISKLILPTALAAVTAVPISMVACSKELTLKTEISDHIRIIINESPKTLKKGKGFKMKGTFMPLTPGVSQLVCDVYCIKKDVSDFVTLEVQEPSSGISDWTLTVPGELVKGNMFVDFSMA